MTIREIDELVEKIDRLVTSADTTYPIVWERLSWPVRRQRLRDLIEEAVKE